jgi:Ca-activated chloride channel family protein
MQSPNPRFILLSLTIAALCACNDTAVTQHAVPPEVAADVAFSPDQPITPPIVAPSAGPAMATEPMAALSFAPERTIIMPRQATRESYTYENHTYENHTYENYASFNDNPIQLTTVAPVSTFSIDVDTGSYSNVRRFLHQGRLPPQDAVRTEELINYFPYDYATATGDSPFQIDTEIAPSPWHEGRHLLRIGLRAVDVAAAQRPRSNLVFLVDVSGSMQGPDRIDLLKTVLKLLTRQLRAEDSVALVVYANGTGVVLEPTPGNQSAIIEAALDRLEAGGGTNGGAGIELAYALAKQHFIAQGINRVLLATDGDFNVGTTSFEALLHLVEAQRQSGISLTTLGFGAGNYNDRLLEQLADAGNGNHAYIDTLNEARKVLVDELSSTLQTVAEDVKVQIEFNPGVVAEYRLVGYENRVLAQEDFNNDKVDAGEIGAGHSVTALYEISLAGSGQHASDPLRYGAPIKVDTADFAGELAFLKLRYKEPGGTVSKLLTRPLRQQDIRNDLAATSDSFRFAAAVAGFGQLLRGGERLGDFDYAAVLSLASGAKGSDAFGYRSEFLDLVRTAQTLAQLQERPLR